MVNWFNFSILESWSQMQKLKLYAKIWSFQKINKKSFYFLEIKFQTINLYLTPKYKPTRGPFNNPFISSLNLTQSFFAPSPTTRFPFDPQAIINT